MQQGKLTHAWTMASAALPLEWTLMGVVRIEIGAPFVTNPIRDDQAHGWIAIAWGPAAPATQHATEFGQGDFPEQALYNLAEKLRQLRGDVNG